MNLSNSMVEKIVAEIASWRVMPLAAFLFGSAARGDGNLESDIDIWLISHEIDGLLVEQWKNQSFNLSAEIREWTGNPASILESSLDDVAGMVREKVPFLNELRRDGIALTGFSLGDLVRAVR